MPKLAKIKRKKSSTSSKEDEHPAAPVVEPGARNVLLCEEYRLIEKNEEHISPLWKSVHLLLFFLAFIFGSFCTFCFHMLMYMFDEKCVLYPKLVSLTNSQRHKKIFEYLPFKTADGQSVAMDYLQTNWSEKSVCYLPTYLPLVSAIFGLVWITMFLMCSTGSRTHTGLQRPWRVMLPVFIFSLMMGSVCFATTLVTHRGLSDFCDKLSAAIGTKTCSYTVNVVTIVYERRISGVYQATMLTIVSAWIHTICWISSAMLVVLRVVLNVDFHLVRVRAVLHGDVDDMLQRYEKQIRTVLPEEKKQSETGKRYTKRNWKMEMLYSRMALASSNQESDLSLVTSKLPKDKAPKNESVQKYISDMLYTLIELIETEMSKRTARKKQVHPKPTRDITPGRSDEYLAVDLDIETGKEPSTSKNAKEKEKKVQISEKTQITSDISKTPSTADVDSDSAKKADKKGVAKVSSKKSVNVLLRTQDHRKRDKAPYMQVDEDFIPKKIADYLTDSFLRIKPRSSPDKSEIKKDSSPKSVERQGSEEKLSPVPELTSSSYDKRIIPKKDKGYISDWDIVFSDDDKRRFIHEKISQKNLKATDTDIPHEPSPLISSNQDIDQKDILFIKKPDTELPEKLSTINKKGSDLEKTDTLNIQEKKSQRPEESDGDSIYLSVTNSELQIDKEILETDDLILSPVTGSEEQISLLRKSVDIDVNKALKDQENKNISHMQSDQKASTSKEHISPQEMQPGKITVSENIIKDVFIIDPDTGSQKSDESDNAVIQKKPKKKQKTD